MSRRRRRSGHAHHDRWLVSYADFITLLFAFFVVLYASSQVDKKKVGKLALAIQVAFQQMGVFDASNTQTPVQGADADKSGDTAGTENSDHAASQMQAPTSFDGVLATKDGSGDLA